MVTRATAPYLSLQVIFPTTASITAGITIPESSILLNSSSSIGTAVSSYSGGSSRGTIFARIMAPEEVTIIVERGSCRCNPYLLH